MSDEDAITEAPTRGEQLGAVNAIADAHADLSTGTTFPPSVAEHAQGTTVPAEEGFIGTTPPPEHTDGDPLTPALEANEQAAHDSAVLAGEPDHIELDSGETLDASEAVVEELEARDVLAEDEPVDEPTPPEQPATETPTSDPVVEHVTDGDDVSHDDGETL